jgi:hypothetical protein
MVSKFTLSSSPRALRSPSQRQVADLFAAALGGDETERDVGFARGFIPGRGFADEHGGKVDMAAGAVNGLSGILWHYRVFPEIPGGFPEVSGVRYGKWQEKC